jgi:hypothetical protein
MEFRCFVLNGSLRAISQYEWNTVYPSLQSQLTTEVICYFM